MFLFLFYACNYYYMTLIITERKWRNHVECVLRKDICMRRSKAVISTCAQSSGDVGTSTTATRRWKHAGQTFATRPIRSQTPHHRKTERYTHSIGCRRGARNMEYWSGHGAGAQPVLQKCLPSTHF